MTLSLRETIEKLSKEDTIKLVDQDITNNLDLFCYIKCEPNDSEIIKNSRGIIFNGEKLVMKAFPYTTEFNDMEKDKITEAIGTCFMDCKFYESHEGALIRMFYFNNKWFLSTHRKLNAFKSKWSSKDSFGSSFKKALEAEIQENELLRKSFPEDMDNILDKFQSTLNTNYQYMFLIRNTDENRIVCQAPKRPTFYHVGTFVEGELNLDVDINIPHPKLLHFLNIEELCEYVYKTNISQTQGVIIFAPDNKQYKVLNKDYQGFFNVRGNEPSIKFRYLQIRLDKKQLEMLCYLYQDKEKVFDEYENILYDIVCNIHSNYIQRFIKKTYITLPKEEFNVLKECHSWHLLDRLKNKVDQNKVMEILNLQTPSNLNHMIHRHIIEQNKKKEMEGCIGKTRDRSKSDISIDEYQPLNPPLLISHLNALNELKK